MIIKQLNCLTGRLTYYKMTYELSPGLVSWLHTSSGCLECPRLLGRLVCGGSVPHVKWQLRAAPGSRDRVLVTETPRPQRSRAGPSSMVILTPEMARRYIVHRLAIAERCKLTHDSVINISGFALKGGFFRDCGRCTFFIVSTNNIQCKFDKRRNNQMNVLCNVKSELIVFQILQYKHTQLESLFYQIHSSNMT